MLLTCRNRHRRLLRSSDTARCGGACSLAGSGLRCAGRRGSGAGVSPSPSSTRRASCARLQSRLDSHRSQRDQDVHRDGVAAAGRPGASLPGTRAPTLRSDRYRARSPGRSLLFPRSPVATEQIGSTRAFPWT